MSTFQVGGHADVVVLLPDPPCPTPTPTSMPTGAELIATAGNEQGAEQRGSVAGSVASSVAGSVAASPQPHGHRRLLKRTTLGEVAFYSVCHFLAKGQNPPEPLANEAQMDLRCLAPATYDAIQQFAAVQPDFLGATPLFASAQTEIAPNLVPPLPSDPIVNDALAKLAQIPMVGSSAEQHTWGLLLSNVAQGMRWPHTMDVKLGHVLYDDRPGRAKPDKVQRMQVASTNSTSGTHGVRLTGWQHWLPDLFPTSPLPPPSLDPQQVPSPIPLPTPAPTPGGQRTLVPVDKKFGKSIDPSGLVVGLRLFLGCATLADQTHFTTITSVAPTQYAHTPTWIVNLLVERAILPSLTRICTALHTVEARFRGSSLLLAYESDEVLHRWALTQLDQRQWDGPPVCAVRLIDFAHSYFALGDGPDYGLLKGLQTLCEAFQTILDEVHSTPGVEAIR